MEVFQTNDLTFEQGLEHIQRALRNAGASPDLDDIVTSRDPAIRKASRELMRETVPDGFSKWQLPVYLKCDSQMFVSVGAPGAVTPEHSHIGSGFRYVVNGSIIVNGKELTPGDWLFVPKDKRYSLTVGDMGATLLSCYCCCC